MTALPGLSGIFAVWSRVTHRETLNLTAGSQITDKIRRNG